MDPALTVVIRRFALGLVVGPFLFSSTACDEAPATHAVVRDSAGIRIVENRAPSWEGGSGWRLAAEPEIDIGGGRDSTDQLHQVNGAVRLADGRIVIANGGSSQLRVYDATGAHVMDIGRRGSGPGEFRYVGGIVRTDGDTLLVGSSFGFHDVIAPDGTWLRRIAQNFGGLFQPPYMSEGGYVLPDGTMLLYVYENVRAEEWGPGQFRAKQGFVRYDPATGTQDTIGWYRGIAHVRDGARLRWVGFSPSTEAAWTANRIYVGDSERYEIEVHDYSGRRIGLIRREWQAPPLTDAMRTEYRTAFVERARGSGTQDERIAQIERMLAEMPWNETVPPFQQLMTDRAGNLWVGHVHPLGDWPTEWTVFDADGVLLGDVSLPDRFRALEIGADYVLGIGRDELDVEHVRMYRLVK